jgi:SpoVK/Ycf46/Vps4 family AAA+-type ATPase
LFDEIDSFDSNVSLKKTDVDTDTDIDINTCNMPYSFQQMQQMLQNIPHTITKNNVIVMDQKQMQSPAGLEKMLNYSEKNDDHKRKFNIGTFLNLLDGTHDQDGMIIIGTANNLNRLDPGLYRIGRLTKISFEYMGRNEISEMIEKYYSVNLTNNQKQTIRNDRIIQNLILKNVCIEHLESNSCDIDELIEQINLLQPEKSPNITSKSDKYFYKKYEIPKNNIDQINDFDDLPESSFLDDMTKRCRPYVNNY